MHNRGERVRMHPERRSCLSETVIPQLVLGLIGEEDAMPMLSHAAQCERCGSALRAATECFSRDLNPAEAAAAEAAMTRLPVRPSRRPRRNIWPLAMAASLLLAAGLSCYFYVTRSQSAVPELLAKAYTAHRPFAWRLPDAGYASLPPGERGTALTIPTQALARAEASLASTGSPKAQVWRAWAALLKRDAAGAIRLLEGAQPASGSAGFESLEVLSVAYCLRADQTGSRADYGRGIAGFDQILAARPADPRAMYNRTLALHRSGQPAQAMESILGVPRTAPDWTDELRGITVIIH